MKLYLFDEIVGLYDLDGKNAQWHSQWQVKVDFRYNEDPFDFMICYFYMQHKDIYHNKTQKLN
jgi:hypothetical protein